MEASSNLSGLGGKEESKRDDSNGDHKEIIHITKIEDGIQVHQSNGSKSLSPKQESNKIAHRRSSSDTKLISSTQKDQDKQLESAKAEMGEVREENERLKTILARIVKDYQSLQMHYFDIVQQEKAKKSTEAIPITLQETEESELISLSLGMGSFEPRKDDKGGRPKEDEEMKEGLSLGLDCKFEGSKPNPAEPATNRSPVDSYGETKDEEVGEQWPPSKILKTMRSGDDEVSQQPQVKKARVSVRARCDTPTMNDGCQWRKYGQKIAKGNPCPRAYYRCTVAPACPVRKQVQRCADDMSILITTYEGSHNHPLPMSATAMASTTSAAACMLMSGSTTSRQGLAVSATSTSTNVSDMNGMNFALSDSSRTRQFYLPNSSISSSPSYPTVTLDLTAPSSSSSSLQSQFTRLSSNFHPTQNYSSTNLNFSSSEPSTLPTSWSNAYLSYGPQSYKNHMGPLNLGRQPQEQFYTPYLQKNNSIPQASMTDTITAATKAITADPSFRSALAAAITSIVSGDGGAHENQPGGENFAQNLKWGEPIAPISTYSSTQNGNGCAST